jgi:cytochrome c oxidase subunit 4
MTTSADRSELWRHMREPVLTFAALMGFLAVNVAIGWFQPFPAVWAAEGAVMVLMIATVLLFSMEVIEQPALVKFFSILGFVWVAILFGMTMIDYITR